MVRGLFSFRSLLTLAIVVLVSGATALGFKAALSSGWPGDTAFYFVVAFLLTTGMAVMLWIAFRSFRPAWMRILTGLSASR
jgi:hypothetical protein